MTPTEDPFELKTTVIGPSAVLRSLAMLPLMDFAIWVARVSAAIDALTLSS